MGTRSFLFVCAISGAISMAGCGTANPIEEAINRIALIATDSTRGSAVSVGKGYFLSARHIFLGRDSTYYSDFKMLYKGIVDSNARFIAAQGDIILIKSEVLGKNDPDVATENDLALGQPVVWIQPLFSDRSIDFYVRTERISRIDRVFVYTDKYFSDGSSGSGMFTSDGKLAALID